MGCISVRKHQKDSTACLGQARLTKKSATVYQEIKTFDRKSMSQAWIEKVDTDMAAPKRLKRANRAEVAVKDLIGRYLIECANQCCRSTGSRRRRCAMIWLFSVMAVPRLAGGGG